MNNSTNMSHNVYCEELSDREKAVFKHFVNKKWKGKIGSSQNNAIAIIRTKSICINEEIINLICRLENRIKKLKQIQKDLNEVSIWL